MTKQARSNPRPYPTASSYRMYEYIVTGFVTELRDEIEYFYNQLWTVSEIPDPKDKNPERYAVVAALPYHLVRAFNRLAERGLPRASPAISRVEGWKTDQVGRLF
ncbi:uncharacterized protein EURHEDRAFT_399565 [Aspergillus ruber CBS 135680]|uniref:Uncharacterized protein n=1 Tax=Aspergillus ruber (strain CBS 135680) TaxID=1388766 RepID=A0A017SR44_ASPRC|nr:uncharacterized protein EURHEDRAFT_399565 [Aspergillus ruber CBS 135680]EYE99291.1 hypothetical protein EURHEDRAFT_399565 [Aspergillus ruber CBS 135680]